MTLGRHSWLPNNILKQQNTCSTLYAWIIPAKLKTSLWFATDKKPAPGERETEWQRLDVKCGVAPQQGALRWTWSATQDPWSHHPPLSPQWNRELSSGAQGNRELVGGSFIFNGLGRRMWTQSNYKALLGCRWFSRRSVSIYWGGSSQTVGQELFILLKSIKDPK